MGITLLSEVPSSAIHLMYYVQTQGMKIDNVIIVREDDVSYDILEQYAKKNDFGTHYVNDPNGQKCKEVLTDLAPEILLLMVSTIISKRVLAIPDKVVNTHTGILPKFRGLDARRWAILEGGPVGVSIHLVDAGVDTGPILKISELPLKSNDTVATIAERNYYTNKWQPLTDALLELEQGDVDPYIQGPNEGKQYFRMHDKLRDLVSDILANNTHPDLQ